MEKLIILICLISLASAISSNKYCDCEQIIVQENCKSDDGCKWVSTGSDSSCTTEVIDCRKYSERTCNNYYECVWKNSVCTTLNVCSDIITTVEGACAEKLYLCTDGAKIGDPCLDVKCSNLDTEKKCTDSSESETLYCLWSNNTCLTIDTTKCSTITDQSVCEDFGCGWINNKCQALTCDDITNPDDCFSVISDDFTTFTLCELDDETCQDASDASSLTQDTCYEDTFDFFAWDGSSCVSCQEFSSYQFIMGIVIISITVFLI